MNRSRPGAQNSNWRGGKTTHPLYNVYNEIKARCRRVTHPRYADYGGRGIQMCEEWYQDFWAFVQGVGERPPAVNPSGRSSWELDRIDNDGNYEPGNVRWATSVQQAHNRRTKKLVDQCRKGHPRNQAYRDSGGYFRCRECNRVRESKRLRIRR